jgi:type I restriction enzyme, S subunit
VTIEATLPANWSSATISELCEINPKHPAAFSNETMVSFVPMVAIDETIGEIVAADDRALGEVRKGYTHFAEGDVLWAKITPCMENGKAAVARGLTNGVGCGTTEFFVLRSRGAVLPEYLHMFMRQPAYRAAARKTMQSGVGQARVPKEFVQASRVPLPPIAEQHRIVAKLEESLSNSSLAGKALDKIPALVERYRQSILAKALRGDLTRSWRSEHPECASGHEVAREILTARRAGRHRRSRDDQFGAVAPAEAPHLPEEWTSLHAEAITEPGRPIIYGIIKPGPHSPEGVPYVRVTEMKDGQIDVTALRRCRPDRARLFARATLRAGDVLVSKDGTIGKVAIVPPELEGGNITQHVLRVSPGSRILPEYLALAIESPFAQSWITLGLKGIGLQGINVGDFRMLPIPIPCEGEQQAIVEAVRLHLDSIGSVSQRVEFAAAQRWSLDGALLAKAFRGELVPQDPNDEPASALTERIRAGVAMGVAEQLPSATRRPGQRRCRIEGA